MGAFTTGTIKTRKSKDRGYRFGRMALNWKDNGKMIVPVDLAFLPTRMAMFMKGSGSMEKRMESESFGLLREWSTKDNGRTTNSTAKEGSSGLMGPSLKEIFTVDKKAEKESSHLAMGAIMRESLMAI